MIEARNLYRSDEAAKFILPLGKTPVVSRKKKIIRILAGTALAAAVIIPAYLAADNTAASIRESHVFSIRKVNVCGVKGSSSQAITDALSSLKGKSLWSLSAADVSAETSKFGFVEGFLMKKQYPSELTVEVRQRGAAGAVRQGSRAFQVDGTGNYWEVDYLEEQVPELKGNNPVGDAQLQSLVAGIFKEGLAGKITSIEPQEPGSFVLTTKENDEIVVFAEDLGGQWAKYRKTGEWIRRNIRAGGRIDLRWSNRVVIVPGIAPQEEVREDGKA